MMRKIIDINDEFYNNVGKTRRCPLPTPALIEGF
jgi:hypothetical protein